MDYRSACPEANGNGPPDSAARARNNGNLAIQPKTLFSFVPVLQARILPYADSLLTLPHAEAAEKSVLVTSKPRSRGYFLKFLAIAATQNNVIGFDCGLQSFGNFHNVTAPFFLTHPLEPTQAEVVFVGFSLFVDQMRKFHGLQDPIDRKSVG